MDDRARRNAGRLLSRSTRWLRHCGSSGEGGACDDGKKAFTVDECASCHQ
jgi:hypothetical protein